MSGLDRILMLLRWKRLILWNTFVVAAASVGIALLLPNWYRSTAAVLPPEEESFSLGSLSSLVSAVTMGAGRSNLPIWATPSDVYAAVLRSRAVREEIIRRFDLIRVYEVEEMDHALKRLEETVTVKVSTEGVVFVRVLDKSPQRAADMANAFIGLLDKFNKEKRTTSARQARIFIEGRLGENRKEMAAAEEELRSIQESTGVLIPDEQLKAVIQTAADLQSQLTLKEVDLAVLRAQVGSDHPEREALEREVASLRRKAAEIDSGGARVESRFTPGRAPTMQIPLRQYPSRGLAYARSLREVKVQEAIYELLTQQYEQYRIQESRDTPTVQILDAAVPATLKTKPIRWLICVSATFTIFVLSLLLAAGLEALGRLKRLSPERWEKVEQLGRELHIAPLLDRL